MNVQQAPRTSGLAITSMICGILGLIIPYLGFILAIIAIVFGSIAIHQTGSQPNLGGRGMAIAGLVLGILAIALWAILISLIAAFGIATESNYSW